MEPTSGYSLSVSSQKRDSVLSTPSNHQATLMHLDSEDYSKAENVRPSYFSDEEDDLDNVNLHDSQNMEAKNQATDILKLADREDGLKVSRATLVHRLTTFKEISTLGEIIHEVNEDLHRSSSIENELPLPEMSNITSIADSLTGMESFTRQNSSKDSSIVLEDIAKSISGTEELTIRPKSQSQGPTNLNVKPVPCNVEPKRELCVIQGVLRKKSPNFLSMWQDRYAVLKDKKLLYYKNDRADNPLGCLDFDLFASTVRVSTKHPKQFIIAPTGSDRTFTFKASSPEERRKWTDALEQHIRASEGRRLLNTSIAIKKNFWKHDRISEIKFLSEAKTGDLLLFRTQNIAAKLQRSMTRSEYDHVGLILKNGDGSIVLFEATGGDGVGLCRWSAFKSYSWHILYEKVVYRKLIVERTRDLIDRAENFVKSTVGKKYSVSPKKLLQRKSTSIAIDTPQDRTFFCSELVAACYKRMGLLPNTISSSQYLPGTFAADKKLSLIGGAKLGEEFLVNFNIQ